MPLVLGVVVVVWPVVCAGQHPQTGDELDEILGGFDTAADSTAQEEEHSRPSGWNLGGRLNLGASYNVAHRPPETGETDWRGLSRLRVMLELEVAARLGERWRLFASGHAFNDFAYAIRGRDSFTPQVLDQYENELELDDTHVAGTLGGGLHLKVGRQVVAWGTSETIRVTDVLNPLDLREPGLTDIESLRLPVAMTRLDWVTGSWTVSGMLIHEIRFDKSPVYGHDFYPLKLPLPPESRPASHVENTEYAVSARGSFRGWDLSLYWADVYDDAPHLALDGGWGIELQHSRLKMLGAACAVVTGDWLLKAEAAHLRGLELFAAPGKTFERDDVLAGLEYFAWDDTSVTVEAVLRHLRGFEPRFANPPDLAREDRFEWVVRFSRLFLHQTLALNLVAITYEPDGSGGAMQRLEARYALTDQLEILGGVVLYQSGDTPGFETIGDNDRLFLEVGYRF